MAEIVPLVIEAIVCIVFDWMSVKATIAAVGIAIGSTLTGWFTGQLWGLGNWAANFQIWWFIVLAFFTNLAVAAVHYYLLRSAVHLADGGIGVLILLMAVNLPISLGIAAFVAGAVGAGTAVNMGSHTFLWGMSYAYGQAVHDVRHGTWLHE
jgi:hypothetical protein